MVQVRVAGIKEPQENPVVLNQGYFPPRGHLAFLGPSRTVMTRRWRPGMPPHLLHRMSPQQEIIRHKMAAGLGLRSLGLAPMLAMDF